MTTLSVEGLTKSFGEKRAVDDVNLEVGGGEVVGLLGPNGAGKTTAFYLITGLLKPTSGRVYLNGEDVTIHPMYMRARKGIGYLPQEPSVFRKLTVEENILAILETLDITERERRERLEDLLGELGISSLAKRKAYTLSGGEKRRLEITRALVKNPSFILLDEPFSGIDPIVVGEAQEIIKDLKSKGIGVLLTDHNVREMLSITDRAYLLYDGVVLKSGSSDFLANDQETRKLYLGEKFKLER